MCVGDVYLLYQFFVVGDVVYGFVVYGMQFGGWVFQIFFDLVQGEGIGVGFVLIGFFVYVCEGEVQFFGFGVLVGVFGQGVFFYDFFLFFEMDDWVVWCKFEVCFLLFDGFGRVRCGL